MSNPNQQYPQYPQYPQAPQQPAYQQAPGPAINQVPVHGGFPQQGGPPQMPNYQPGYGGQQIQQQAVEEHWILNSGGAPEQHLGFIKETFRRGSVITHDMTNNRLVVNGRVFYDTRDLEILKSQSRKNPHKPWVIPYSEEGLQEVMYGVAPAQLAPNVQDPRDHSMPIVQEDSTSIAPIDIRHTKVAANNAARQADHRQRVAGAPMEIIRGDEGVDERIARLKGKNDPRSLAEREQLKRQPWKPEIIRDDSLGAGVSSGEIPLNAGQPLPSRESAARNAESAAAGAAARKATADMNRGYGVPQQQAPPQGYPPQAYQQMPQAHYPPQVAGVDPALFDEIAPGFPQGPAPQQAPAPQAPPVQDNRVAVLEGQVGEIAGQMGMMMQMMQAMTQNHAAESAGEPQRVPVTDDAQAAAVASQQGG